MSDPASKPSPDERKATVLERHDGVEEQHEPSVAPEKSGCRPRLARHISLQSSLDPLPESDLRESGWPGQGTRPLETRHMSLQPGRHGPHASPGTRHMSLQGSVDQGGPHNEGVLRRMSDNLHHFVDSLQHVHSIDSILKKERQGSAPKDSDKSTLSGKMLRQYIKTHDITSGINLIISGNVNLDERDEEGQTFLMLACQGETASRDLCREILCHSDSDLHAVDLDNWTALLNAAKAGHADIVSLLLNSGAEIEHKDLGDWTALMWACYKGRTEAVRRLLAAGANPNWKDENQISGLTWAAGRGSTEIVQLMLQHGAKVNTTDKYGTTPVIWAARKGHTAIVDALLAEGATVDNIGMNSWTALILAAKGGYADVVDSIIACNPNLKTQDKDGNTALTWAVKGGHMQIVTSLLGRGAYVNTPDRQGDTILIHAVKGGHADIIASLLKKYADVNVQGLDDKTALYWAVDKGHVELVKTLLDKHGDTELATKDGDTPLLKAVRTRAVDVVRMLLAHGAKVTATDKSGDTALHVSVRGRSKRVTELLLQNPKDSRLLYRPNRYGETPYHMDATQKRSILTQIFGARNLNAEESTAGYDLYSSILADVLSDPSLRTPITVGLFAKWGSGKSSVIGKLQKEMRAFTRHNALQLDLTPPLVLLPLLPSILLFIIFYYAVSWPWALGVGLVTLIAQYVWVALVLVGTHQRVWPWAEKVGEYMATRLQHFTLLLQVLFCNEPTHTKKETDAVKFLFTNNARLASVVGEKSITGMIGVLCDALEGEYGALASRLFRIVRPAKASHEGRFKTVVFVPYFVITAAVLILLLAGVIILLEANKWKHPFTDENGKYSVYASVLIAIAVIVGLTVLGHVYKWAQMAWALVMSSKRRIAKLTQLVDAHKIGGVMQTLKKEVEVLGQLVSCTDSFLHSSTRLVIIVDGLDLCEQEKLLALLDTVHLLFDDTQSPFITVLTIDPHVVIKGIEHTMTGNGLFHDSGFTGHDYMRNLVHLPFFLQSQAAAPLPPSKDADTFERKPSQRERRRSRHNTDEGQRLRRNTAEYKEGGPVGSDLSGAAQASLDMPSTFKKNSAYFADINPKNLRRLKNIVAVTGRLLRAYLVDFNWFRLAAWVNLTEQWPYRLSWVLQHVEDHPDLDNTMTLKALYDIVHASIPATKEQQPLLKMDRNVRKFEMFLASHTPPLMVSDLHKFLPYTINLDPHLRKVIRDHSAHHHELLGLHADLGEGDTQSQSQQQQQNAAHPINPAWPPTGPYSAIPHLMCGPPHHGNGLQPVMYGPLHNMAISSRHQGFIPGAPVQPTLYSSPSHSSASSLQTLPPPVPSATTNTDLIPAGDDRLLSSLSVDDVCALLTHLPTLSSQRLTAYTATLRNLNISGLVLASCPLNELKTELGWNFGDWEVFKNAVKARRQAERPAIQAPQFQQLQPQSMPMYTQHLPPAAAPSALAPKSTATKPKSAHTVHHDSVLHVLEYEAETLRAAMVHLEGASDTSESEGEEVGHHRTLTIENRQKCE